MPSRRPRPTRRPRRARKAVGVSVVSRSSSQVVLSVGLGGALGAGRTTSISLGFDLPDPGGRPDRPIRVGASLVTFPVWAYGSAGVAGSTVTVRFPAGYDVRVVAGQLGAPVSAPDGSIKLASGAIADPLAFNAVVAADRPSSFVETKVDVTIAGQPASLLVRAWPDDPAWGTRMAALIRSSLPLLAAQIGLPYQPSTSEVAVEEALPRSIDGYAATYLPDEGRIQVAYTADDTVAIHELAHLWFDGSLFADRWIDDGFAIFYGNRVAPGPQAQAARRVDHPGPGGGGRAAQHLVGHRRHRRAERFDAGRDASRGPGRRLRPGGLGDPGEQAL